MKLFNWLKSFRHRAGRRAHQRRAGVGQRSLSAWRNFGMTAITVGPSVEGLEDRALLTFGAVFELSGLTGANGFQISGEVASDLSGRSVSNAGDINGDGIADLIIGANRVDQSGVDYGASYMVFGSSTPFSANLNLSGLTGTNGFKISGVAINDRSGESVSAAGDINGDGIDDLIIGAPQATRTAPTLVRAMWFRKPFGLCSESESRNLDGHQRFQDQRRSGQRQLRPVGERSGGHQWRRNR